MKHIILIHALLMNSLSMSFLKKQLDSASVKIHTFDYKSTQYKKDTIKPLNDLVQNIIEHDSNAEITLVGHSMGGLIGRLFLTEYKPTNIHALITMGTPHRGSEVGKNFSQTKLGFLLGSSGNSGIVGDIPEWRGEYKLFCLVGITKIKTLASIFTKNPEDGDGTVFVEEAWLMSLIALKPCLFPN